MSHEDLKSPSKAPLRPAPARVLRSRDLFGGSRELRILHEGVEYRLRRTRYEKLILTK
jgi:hemin uptake protein HemP